MSISVLIRTPSLAAKFAHQGAGPLDEHLPDVRFASHPSARRQTAA
jgi:hypothetical protein